VKVGLPLNLVTVNAKEECGFNWDVVRKKYLLQQQTTDTNLP